MKFFLPHVPWSIGINHMTSYMCVCDRVSLALDFLAHLVYQAYLDLKVSLDQRVILVSLEAPVHQDDLDLTVPQDPKVSCTSVPDIMDLQVMKTQHSHLTMHHTDCYIIFSLCRWARFTWYPWSSWPTWIPIPWFIGAPRPSWTSRSNGTPR